MRRRDFIKAITASAAWPLTARAQQPALPVIGFLSSRSEQPDAPFVSAFRQGLVESGDVGKSATIEFRWADNQSDRLESLAANLIKLKPATILAGGGSGTALALKKLTSSIPIVFVMGTDPVKVGLVHSMSRPEGNLTGVAFLATQIVAKRLEFLLAFVPNAKRIAVLVNPKNPELASMTRDVETAERSLKIAMQTYQASTEDEIDGAFSQMAPTAPGCIVDRWRHIFQRRPSEADRAFPALFASLYFRFARVRDRRRINELRNKPDQSLPAGGGLCWSHSERR
jgi:ABC-type uncharacterized transport system substrate-binding protein